MKKHSANDPDQQWFDEAMGDAIARFDASHSPGVPELDAFERLVQARKREARKRLWRDLTLFWLTACFVFGSMAWVLERNWIWFAALQVAAAAGGAGFVACNFGRRTWSKWKS
ncbi:YxlC family protein [Paenibacillus arenilitoris]|uniref:YxlC family protein n=1 Tax=Paenibacillus arenilitoris TaxID=2772299 RepID=A0A927CNP6_9BACL|nr:YxlC family protein [Paenibacillus arenilitoris]MBD2870909.1 YxlC family protein [Paenibacillus arenilitoris]